MRKKVKKRLLSLLLCGAMVFSLCPPAAAAVKDGGGVLVGERTYGKGVIQETVFFDDGTGVSLTTREFFSPSGKAINKKGVKPDIEKDTGSEPDRDLQLEAAIAEIKGSARKG